MQATVMLTNISVAVARGGVSLHPVAHSPCPAQGGQHSCQELCAQLPPALPDTALGNRGVGRRTSPRSAKAGGILGLLGQPFSDIAELQLGAGAGWRGGVSLPLRKRLWGEVLSPQGQLGRRTPAG